MRNFLLPWVFLFVVSAFAMEHTPQSKTKFIPRKETCGAAIKADGSNGFPDTLEAALMCFEAGFRNFYETHHISAIDLPRELQETLSQLHIVFVVDANNRVTNYIFNDQGKNSMAAFLTLHLADPCITCNFHKNEIVDNKTRFLNGIRNGILFNYEKEDIRAFLKRSQIQDAGDFDSRYQETEIQLSEMFQGARKTFDSYYAKGEQIFVPAKRVITAWQIRIPCPESRHDEFKTHSLPTIILH